MEILGFPQFRAMILSSLPNVVQAIFAAIGDYYTWKMSEKIYGLGSNSAWAAVSNAPLIVIRLLILHARSL
jgi:phosphatidylinositol glycan class B